MKLSSSFISLIHISHGNCGVLIETEWKNEKKKNYCFACFISVVAFMRKCDTPPKQGM